MASWLVGALTPGQVRLAGLTSVVVAAVAALGLAAGASGTPTPDHSHTPVTSALGPGAHPVSRTAAGPRHSPDRVTRGMTSPRPARTAAAASPTAHPPHVDRLAAFRGFGAWVDTYDYGTLDPGLAVADMRAHGVRTLYLGTARSDSRGAFVDSARTAAWLDDAHAAGLRVVGWYAPDYADLDRDIRRTVAIADFRTASGQRFDALAIDMEYPLVVPDPAAWSDALAQQLTAVDAATSLPIGAIVLPPLLMSAWRTDRWATFPWAAIGRHADAVLLMDYWTSYTPATLCPHDPAYCVQRYTVADVAQAARLTGLPVHAIGGVGDVASAADTALFARTVAHTGAIGASFYDYATTSPADWTALQPVVARGG